jgi:hypothetical protein
LNFFGFGTCKSILGCGCKTLPILSKYIAIGTHNYLISIMFHVKCYLH